MIVNRLKGVLNDIITPYEASFVLGRQSVDNIVISQEVVHTLRYTRAKKGGKVLKLDLEKIYDRLE